MGTESQTNCFPHLTIIHLTGELYNNFLYPVPQVLNNPKSFIPGQVSNTEIRMKVGVIVPTWKVKDYHVQRSS